LASEIWICSHLKQQRNLHSKPTKFDAIKNTEGGKKRNVKKTETRNDRFVLKRL
jgi:hypothetical protein